MKIKAIVLTLVLGILQALVPSAASADLPQPPAGPVFNQVQLKVLADNDFAVFMGNDTEITRLFYQNMVSWPDQVNNIQTLDVYPESGETYIYIVPMGGNGGYRTDSGGTEGGGEEDWNGVLNGIALLDYPGAEVAVGRRVADARDVIEYDYLLIHKYLTGFEANQSAIAGGTFSATLPDMSTASQNLIWAPALRNNHPSRIIIKNSCSVSCSGSRFNPAIANGAWNVPDGAASLFRYPLSNANLPVSPGDRQVTVTWKDPGAGGAVDNYLVEYKESSQPDSTFKVFGTVPGTSRTSTVTGLTNGTAYTLRVTANNAAGSASSYGRSVVPTGTPSRPANQSYSAGDGSVSINFSPPENDGGLAVTNYAYSVDEGVTWITRSPASTSSPITISGLTNGTDYSVRLRAINPFGAGQISLPIAVKPGIVSTRTLTYESGTLATVTGLAAGRTFNAGDTFTVAAGPTRTNFTFTGWKDGNVSYAAGDTYTVGASNPTLTAQWVQNSLLGVTPGSRSKVLTWNIVANESIDLTVAAGTDNSVRIQIPANALAAGTEVIFWRLLDDQLAKARISDEREYFVNLAVTWSKGDDVNTPMVVENATTPIVLTLMNSSIVEGATAWQIIGETARIVGNAERAGELTLRFTEDPVITAANEVVIATEPTPTPSPTVDPTPSPTPTPSPAPRKRTIEVGGFAGGSAELTAAMKSSMNSFLNSVSDPTKIRCTGYTMGPTVLRVDMSLAKRRAQAVCDYMISKAGSITSRTTLGKTTVSEKTKYRRTTITLTY
ncbi:fibronectin type III domain-containing protein [Rhodoluna limnophila]|uniref:fibronectin type III domain-containing protein n=1 Tax=Rhodoluna limnophila TaxID=232537 RepID=UPI001105DDDA|nr:fibronectin type III domain-containing protein [Rhodoluna limnophila]